MKPWKTLGIAVIGSVTAVGFHAAGHYLAGDPAVFDQAGVRTAGLAVGSISLVGTALAYWLGG